MTLEDLYSESGYPGFSRFWDLVKKKKLPFSYDKVKEFIQSQKAYQLHKQTAKKSEELRPITTSNKQIEMQVDLLDMSNFFRQNKGFRWILIAVDIFTRKAWAVPLKHKTASETSEGMEVILKDSGIPKVIASDDGSEFKGAFAKLLKDKDIFHKVHDVGDHRVLGIIDRFSKTIKTVLYKKFTATNDVKWLDYLKKYISTYNNLEHASLCGMSPNEAEKYTADTLKCHYENLQKRLRNVEPLKIGDTVRIKNLRKTFDKGYEIKYSLKTHKITGIQGLRYVLDNSKSYRYNMLQKVPAEEKEEEVKEPEVRKEKRKHKIEKELAREDIKEERIIRPKRERKTRAIMTDLGLLRLL